MSALMEELAAFAAVPERYASAPQGRRVLRDVLDECPTLRALVVAAGVDPEGLLGPSRSHAPWTEDEERRLSEMYWAGATLPEMAAALSRGRDGTLRRLYGLGLHMRDREKKEES